jgi:hypothetical protein
MSGLVPSGAASSDHAKGRRKGEERRKDLGLDGSSFLVTVLSCKIG